MTPRQALLHAIQFSASSVWGASTRFRLQVGMIPQCDESPLSHPTRLGRRRLRLQFLHPAFRGEDLTTFAEVCHCRGRPLGQADRFGSRGKRRAGTPQSLRLILMA